MKNIKVKHVTGIVHLICTMHPHTHSHSHWLHFNISHPYMNDIGTATTATNNKIMRIIIITCRNYIVCRSGVCLYYYYVEYTSNPLISSPLMIIILRWLPGQWWWCAKPGPSLIRSQIYRELNEGDRKLIEKHYLKIHARIHVHTYEIETSHYPFKTSPYNCVWLSFCANFYK